MPTNFSLPSENSRKTFRFHQLVAVIGVFGAFATFSVASNGTVGVSAAFASVEPIPYSSALELAHLNHTPKVNSSGKVVADSNWKTSVDPDGTDLLTAKTGNTKAAIMRSDAGEIETFVAYSLTEVTKTAANKVEASSAIFFAKPEGVGSAPVAALTTCEDSGDKDSIGRICVTATPRLCQGLRSGQGVDPETLKEMESYETRALSAILTLRGSDHQLDNLVSSGNRLGLKSSLQTTKGQLMALAKQVSKELGQSAEVSGDAKEKKIIAEQNKAENLLAKNVLEKSLPRLKQSCQDSRF